VDDEEGAQCFFPTTGTHRSKNRSEMKQWPVNVAVPSVTTTSSQDMILRKVKQLASGSGCSDVSIQRLHEELLKELKAEDVEMALGELEEDGRIYRIRDSWIRMV